MTGISGIESTVKAKNILLGISGLREILNQIYLFSTQDQIIIRKKCPLHFIEISHKITDIQCIKLDKDSELLIFDISMKILLSDFRNM